MPTGGSNLTPPEEKIVADIDRVGWHCMSVSDPGDPHEWSYTIGFYKTWNHAELIAFGLAPERAHTLLWNLADEIADGRAFSPNDRFECFEGGYEGVFLSVAPEWLRFMGLAVWFYGGELPTLQCVWPDSEHRLPWQGGEDPRPQLLLISGEDERRLGYVQDKASLLGALGFE
jgi:hypothetical protein